jgi:hypothetical protein
MNLILIIEGLPHCPRNRSHSIVKSKTHSFLAKTAVARAYEDAVKQELRQYAEQIEEFKKSFDKNCHALMAQWRFYSPEVLTQTGKVNENGTDLDAHKVLQDTIMEVVGIDDAYITVDHRSKYPGDYKVYLTLKLLEIKDDQTVH